MAVSNIRMPRLLKAGGGEAYRLNPAALSVSESLWGLTTASMTLPQGEQTAGVRDLVEIFGTGGSFGIFRVSSTTQLPGEAQMIDLEHTLAVLEDDVTPAKKTLTGTMRQIITALLGYQYTTRWRLGDVECAESGLELTVDRMTVRDALVAAVQLVDDYGIYTEQTDTVWTIHIRKMPTAPTCECRLSRNAAGVQVEIDDHDLCTRVVAEELPGGEMKVDSPWGVVTHVLSVPAGASEAQAKKYATSYLDQHKEPSVSIRIDALELAHLTGEAWDSFQRGGMCRAALADYGIVQDKRIISLDHPELLVAPDKVRLELAKPGRRIEEIIANNRRGAGGAGRAAADAEKGLVLYDARIGLITEDLQSAMVRLSQAEAEILLKVSKDGIISAINLSPEQIDISASKINLNGYVTAQDLSAWGGTIAGTEVRGDVVKATALWVNGTHVVTRNVQGTDGSTYRALVMSPSG